MDFTDVVNSRHSVRDFSDKQISNELLTKIVKLAQRTPSWANSQPWNVYIAKGDALARIKKLHLERDQKGEAGNSEMQQIHRFAWGKQPLDNMQDWSISLGKYLGMASVQMNKAQANLFNASALVYLTVQKEVSPWMVYDVGAFGQTLMLAAKNEGIDSMPAYEIVRFPEDIHHVMQIPANEEILMGIALGYPTDRKINSFYSDRDATKNILSIKENN